MARTWTSPDGSTRKPHSSPPLSAVSVTDGRLWTENTEWPVAGVVSRVMKSRVVSLCAPGRSVGGRRPCRCSHSGRLGCRMERWRLRPVLGTPFYFLEAPKHSAVVLAFRTRRRGGASRGQGESGTWARDGPCSRNTTDRSEEPCHTRVCLSTLSGVLE